MNKYGLYLDNEKLIGEKNKYRFHCKCGYSVTIYPFEKYQRKLCYCCGNYIYADKRYEFKEKIKERIKL